MTDIDLLIKKFDLKPHPEGGYFKESYRSSGMITETALPDNYKGNRNHSTCIYFLLTSDMFSAFHRIKQDEIWHFYAGSPLKLHVISGKGEYSEHTIGNNFSDGQVPQFVVSGGDWFAANTIASDGYSFVGCTVAPGFDFADFELPERKELIAKFPNHAEIVTALTRA